MCLLQAYMWKRSNQSLLSALNLYSRGLFSRASTDSQVCTKVCVTLGILHTNLGNFGRHSWAPSLLNMPLYFTILMRIFTKGIFNRSSLCVRCILQYIFKKWTASWKVHGDMNLVDHVIKSCEAFRERQLSPNY